MEKRYQVFVSSTFRDLVDERQSALKAVLELDHMPAGMELFPASDESAWELIRDIIDASDYYVLIIGGRYGSLDATGLGYTEKEYQYASTQKKPVIALLHQNPDNLPRDKTETEELAWKKLLAFRKIVESRHTCVYWTKADELKAHLIVALTSVVKRHPAVGWVRADRVPTDATMADLLTLRNRVADLEVQLDSARRSPPAGTDDLYQGTDQFEIHLTFAAGSSRSDLLFGAKTYRASVKPTWDEIFAAVAPSMINEASQASLKKAFIEFFEREAKSAFESVPEFKDKVIGNFKFEDQQIDTCIIQLRALGLIRENQRKRSVHDKGTYWTLTPFGDQRMVQLRALRRDAPVREKDATHHEAPTDTP